MRSIISIGSVMRYRILLLLAVVIIGVTVSGSPFAVAQTPPDVQIIIGDLGFEPSMVTVFSGQGIHWTNESSDVHTVTADSGLFDSGNLATNCGFSIALAIPGVHTYRSSSDPSFEGKTHVVLEGLSGPANALANDNIPEITFPIQLAEDMSTHPDFGFVASRTRILLGSMDATTVAEANAAIQAANVVVIGGLPDVDILLVAAPDTTDFSGLKFAIDSLLADPAVEFAAMSPELQLSELPRPADAITGPPPFNWTWEVTTGPNGEPLGTTGNWTLEASRLPQAELDGNDSEERQRRVCAHRRG